MHHSAHSQKQAKTKPTRTSFLHRERHFVKNLYVLLALERGLLKLDRRICELAKCADATSAQMVFVVTELHKLTQLLDHALTAVVSRKTYRKPHGDRKHSPPPTAHNSSKVTNHQSKKARNNE